MRLFLKYYLVKFYSLTAVFVFILSHVAFADIYFTILTVNGTEEAREKEIRKYLPKELTLEDILDTAGLQVDYDVNEEAYFVHGKVALAAKETKTLKIRIRDLWKIEEEDVNEIKSQIDSNFELLEGTQYYDLATLKRENLHQRLDYIIDQQQKYTENVGKRIDRFRAYSGELKLIRENALSVKFWRSIPPAADETKIVKFIIELENPYDVEKTLDQKHYLPKDIKPEHIIDTKGFEIGFDAKEDTSYLNKEETLQPNEKKRYEIEVVDIWNIDQNEIINLKNRTREAYELLENSRYVQGAAFLVKNIKEQLGKIEVSQSIETDITEHISIYNSNTIRHAKATDDVQILEELVEIIREELERSKLKNVLQKIRSLKSIADIAEAIFGVKPSAKNAWKIILGIMVFVGAVTVVHFAVWGRRSKEAKITTIEGEEEQEKEEK